MLFLFLIFFLLLYIETLSKLILHNTKENMLQVFKQETNWSSFILSSSIDLGKQKYIIWVKYFSLLTTGSIRGGELKILSPFHKVCLLESLYDITCFRREHSSCWLRSIWGWIGMCQLRDIGSDLHNVLHKVELDWLAVNHCQTCS